MTTPHDTLRSTFAELDEDGDGKLDSDELQELCSRLGYDPDKVDDIVQLFDETGDGKIDFDEFSCMFYPAYEDYNIQPASPDSDYNPCMSPEEEEEQYESGQYEFVDTTFDTEEVLQAADGAGDGAVWVRAHEIISVFRKAKLFKSISPHDINQGGLGDCWLLCALATMTEFPGLIQSCFKYKHLNPECRHEIKVWDGKTWNGVVISDLIPATGCALGASEPLYAKPRRGELWVPMLEKALAKWMGGYENLDGGLDICAWRMLVGRDDCKILECEDGVWTVHDALFTHAKMIDCEFGPGRRVNPWDTIWEWEQANSLLGAATWKGDSTGEVGFSGGEDIRTDGIVKGHAYSLLQLVDLEEHNLKLIQLRNPWGNEQEWTGAWSDGSEEWDEYPDLAELLNVRHKDDGMFWMSFEDFVNIFERVSMCPHEMPSARRTNLSGKTEVAKPYRRGYSTHIKVTKDDTEVTEVCSPNSCAIQ
eukprot:gnl/MRDRNA2_/MRDRNA2_39142_c0_seq1.p1 gnl/MRDRNA2_/MRDRNA2_39142_c0~~gnl/MRDRNA2_/MRDRNA2_39142_c0_seq1.p1  ORF type:complete len:558 (+),score=90.72 gnl/MRDRNA2_/MRDRNA2_39142_c0_seq1:246-1676(+)